MISAVSDTSTFTPNRLIAALGTSRMVSARSVDRAAEQEQSGAGGATSLERIEDARAVEAGPVGKSELTEEDKAQIKELEKRDTEVRRHEQAHKAAAGQYARGGPNLKYQIGPDGKRYAVGGEVKIDTSPVPSDPEATIRKMQQVRRAALAPASPSAEDRQVAAEAAATAQQARVEASKERANPSESKHSAGTPPSPGGRAEPSGSPSLVPGQSLSPAVSRLSGAFSPKTLFSPGSFIDVRV